VLLLMLTLARTDWARAQHPDPPSGTRDRLALLNLLAVPLIVWPIWQAIGLWPAWSPLSASAPWRPASSRPPRPRVLAARLLARPYPHHVHQLLVPFTLPPLALWLLGLDLKIGALDLSLRLALIMVSGC
jgi:BASS family bile acid:Na+ symporter